MDNIYINIYQIFKNFGWLITRTNVRKYDKSLFPKQSILKSIVYMHSTDQHYFLNLFYLCLCKDIFTYAKKSQLTWSEFKEYFKYSTITVAGFSAIKYRWDITTTFSRESIGQFEADPKNVISDIQVVIPTDVLKLDPKKLSIKTVPTIKRVYTPYLFDKNNEWWVIPKDEVYSMFNDFRELKAIYNPKPDVSVYTRIINVSSNNLCNIIVIDSLENIQQIYRGFKVAKMLGSQSINSTGVTTSQLKVAVYLELKLVMYSGLKTIPFVGLRNTRSSCYMDVILFSLFYINSSTIDEYFFKKPTTHSKFREELLKIRKTIRGDGVDYTVSDLRKALKSMKGGDRFGGCEEQESAEFLEFLLNAFKVQLTKIQYRTYGTNDLYKISTVKLTNTFIDNKGGITNYIDSFKLQKPEYKLSQFLRKIDDSILEEPYISDNGKEYIRRITIEKIVEINSDIYIFVIGRADPVYNKILDNIVVPDNEITIDDKKFGLYSVIVYTGDIERGHYYSYFVYNNIWYKYNDIASYFDKIGTYKKLLEETSVNTDGVIHFYRLKK